MLIALVVVLVVAVTMAVLMGASVRVLREYERGLSSGSAA